MRYDSIQFIRFNTMRFNSIRSMQFNAIGDTLLQIHQRARMRTLQHNLDAVLCERHDLAHALLRAFEHDEHTQDEVVSRDC